MCIGTISSECCVGGPERDLAVSAFAVYIRPYCRPHVIGLLLDTSVVPNMPASYGDCMPHHDFRLAVALVVEG